MKYGAHKGVSSKTGNLERLGNGYWMADKTPDFETPTCQISPDGFHADIFGPDSERYARMFSAAPDMLAALQSIRHTRDYHAEHGVFPSGTIGADQCFDDWAAQLADAAITKATGGAVDGSAPAPAPAVTVAECLDVIRAMNSAIYELAHTAGDDDRFNEGGVAYEATELGDKIIAKAEGRANG